MNQTKKITLFVLSIFFCLNGWSTHSTGLDLTYQCLEGDTFLVRLAFYRDCAGVNAPGIGGKALPTIDITSNTCAQNLTATLALISSQEAGTVCSSLQTTCSGGTYPGIEEYIYEDTVVLPATCVDWIFSYALCCRNNAITTINPTNVDIYVEAKLNNVVSTCNNSPIFSNTPVPFVCIGSTYCFNNGAVDPDGDSLAYKLVTPTTGPNPGDTVNYVAGYSSTDPISSSPILSLDPITGDICMTPTQLEVTVMQIQIEEWRNGNLIGTVERDIQIRVINCPVPNNLPYVNGINGTGIFTASICAGDSFCFFTDAIDLDTSHTVTMSWNSGIVDGNFIINGSPRPTGNFCWIPDSTDISTAPHCFTVTVEDDNCPFMGTQTFSFCITVFGYMSTSIVSQDISCVGDCDGQATVNVVGGFPPYTYLWDDPGNQSSQTASNLCPGNYTVTVTDSLGCAPTAQANILSPLPFTLTLDSTAVTCNGLSDGTTLVNVSGGTGGYNYSWNSAPIQTTANATGLPAGIYTVTITDSNNCDTTANVTILEPSSLAIGASAISNVSCNGLNNGSANVNITGGTSPYSILWDAATGNQTDTTAINLSAGSYSVIVTDTNGCTDTGMATITQPTQLTASISNVVHVGCFGGNTGNATVNATGGTTPYSYLWDASTGNQTTPTAINLLAGSYGVVVTDTNGCSDSTSVVINEPSAAITASFLTSDVSCNGGNNGIATAVPSGGTPPYSYLWDANTGNQTTASANGLPAGTYGITISDTNGCVFIPGIVIGEPQPLSVITSFTNVNCFGGNDGSANVSIAGGTTPYSTTWDAGTGNQTDTTAINLFAGNYNVNITDSNGCSLDTNLTINQPLAPISLSTSSTHLNCFGDTDGSSTLSISGGTSPYSVLWDAATGNQTDTTATNLSAGNYSVIVTDTNGCVDTAMVTISEPTQLTASISNVVHVGCFGGNTGNATVNATGGRTPYSYLWDAGTGNQTTPTAINLLAGSYGVVVTDTNGCSDSTSVVINEPSAAITASFLTSDVSCNGGNNGIATAVPSGGTPPYSYLWDANTGNQTTASANGLPAGTYGITISDTNGCVFIPGIVIGEPQPLSVITSFTNVNCFGGNDGSANVSIAGGTTPYSTTWDAGTGNQTDTTAINLFAGNYNVNITDSNGCSLDTNLTINQPLAPISLSTSSTHLNCFGDTDGSSTLSISGGTSPYSVLWDAATGNQTDTTAINLSAGSYSVIVTDTNGCVDTAIATITQPTSPLTLNLSVTPVTCFGGNNGEVVVLSSGGTYPYTYVWSPTVNNPFDSVATGLTAGEYKVSVTDTNGCLDSLMATVAQPEPLTLSISPNDTICPGASANIIASTSGGNGGATFSWNQGLNNQPSHTVSPAIQTTYSVSISDSLGCTGNSDSTTVFLYFIDTAGLTTSSSGNICQGDSTLVGGNYSGGIGTVSFSWNQGLGNDTGTFVVSPNDTTDYILTVTDQCNNTFSDTIQVLVFPLPLINLPSNYGDGCLPHTIQFIDSLNDNSNMNYLWDFGDGFTSTLANPNYTYIDSGTYHISLSITSMQGCQVSSDTSSTVTIFHSPSAFFDASPTVTDLQNPTITFTNLTADSTLNIWSFGNGDSSNVVHPIYTYSDTGVYYVHLEVINEYGCSSTYSSPIIINPFYTFTAPNAFTPSSSGGSGGAYDINSLSNDVFYLFTEYVEEFELMIFNRWGELLFVSNDVNIGWDGWYRGKICQQDTYVWKANITYVDGSSLSKVGDITLIR